MVGSSEVQNRTARTWPVPHTAAVQMGVEADPTLCLQLGEYILEGRKR